MKVVLQRVSRCAVRVNGKVVGEIGQGVLLLVGVHQEDSESCADFLAAKCADLRIFSDTEGKMNLTLKEVNGAALVVSQFTLYGDCGKGRRPNFMAAAGPEKAKRLYDRFVESMRKQVGVVATGVFGAMMEVELVNDGPVTLILERDDDSAPPPRGGEERS